MNVLASYLDIELNEINKILKKKENNCLQKDKVKEILNIVSDKSIKYSIDKAQEKFLINKEFREMYFEIQDGINKII